jgi:hypothetical protein
MPDDASHAFNFRSFPMGQTQYFQAFGAERAATISLDAELVETRRQVAAGEITQADAISYLRYAGCFEAEIQEAVGA